MSVISQGLMSHHCERLAWSKIGPIFQNAYLQVGEEARLPLRDDSSEVGASHAYNCKKGQEESAKPNCRYDKGLLTRKDICK